MAYHLKRKETVEEGVRRIACERIACALKALEDPGGAEGIHRARKEIKRLRALLRLVRPGLKSKVYRRQTQVLREAANLLAAARDAHVTLKAYNDLQERFRKQLGSESFGQVKKLLEHRYRQAAEHYEHASAARAFTQALRGLERDLGHLRLSAQSWASVSSGVSWSYRCGRRARDHVLEEPSTENLHEWRKRVKDLWYQALLLRRVRPRQLRALARELEELSDLLGDDHDLVLLQAVAAELRLNGREGGALRHQIAQRQEQLRSDALVLGERFYAEKPAEFCRRLGRYWKAWCAGKGKPKRVARTSVQA